MNNSTSRFANRVEEYLKYRPHYPRALLDRIRQATALEPNWVIADVGSGTGFSAELFLEEGNTVFLIEPNREMREAGARYLQKFDRAISVDGTAEATGLQARSVDLVLAGQAFHWFDPMQARNEFERVLRGEGWTVLVWNERETDTTPFLQDYEALLLEFGTDYAQINHRNITRERIEAFFSPSEVREFAIENIQRVDFEGLEGRLMSSSYVPARGEPRADEMLAALARLFDTHSINGTVDIVYTCRAWIGKML